MRIALLISGGVDSSLSAYLLKSAGFNITAFYIKVWMEEELSFMNQEGGCPWEEDVKYASQLCKKLGIPFETVNMQREYMENVVTYLINEVKSGRTPSPDLFCNKLIKFGLFVEKYASEFEFVASGHYATINRKMDGSIELHEANDPVKDQTYFLSYMNEKQFEKLLFPVGSLLKSDVLKISRNLGIAAAQRKESQGICFLGKIDYGKFLEERLGINPGELIEYETDKVVGEHRGHWFYTIGQRKKIGLSGGPWYVVKKDPKRNKIYISNRYFSTEKKRNKLLVENINLISSSIEEITSAEKLFVKIRHGAHKYLATARVLEANGGKTTVEITLDSRDQGIAPGQFAVFYNKRKCLGAGKILLGES